MQFVIWSKDRAAQLYLLLESIDPFPFTITVLYKTSSPFYSNGYDICKKRFSYVRFVEENSFMEDSISIIEDSNNYVTFLTDDTVFYRNTNFKEMFDVYGFLGHKNSNVFSFRLGHNTYIQDHINNIKQSELVVDGNCNNVIFWNPNKYPGYMNYGYPFAIDAHVYHKDFILPLIKSFKWKNTNDLEGGLQNFNNNVNLLGSFRNSKAVNIPYNNISGLTMINLNNKCSLENSNKKFLEGCKINLGSIKKSEIVGCHQDVNLEWVIRDNVN